MRIVVVLSGDLADFREDSSPSLLESAGGGGGGGVGGGVGGSGGDCLSLLISLAAAEVAGKDAELTSAGSSLAP